MSRELLNTLFVMTPGAQARLDGDTVRVEANGEKLLHAPLLHLGSIVLFGGAAMTAPLLMRCAEDGREVTWLDFAGRFKARVVGPTSGNVLLRKAQYDTHAREPAGREIARTIVAGKIRNTRSMLLRGSRETKSAEDSAALQIAAQSLAELLDSLPDAPTLDHIRGIEGQAAACYFDSFGLLISRDPSDFSFRVRSRRPPRDRVNALLSFLYALVLADCVAAAEGVGLDPQFGFLHVLRPGRPALALDLMEEFRAIIADRLALAMMNRKQIDPDHFEERPGGSVMLTADGRKAVLAAYQARKREEVVHPFLKSRTPLGLVPHLQARLLARLLRGDLPAYLPYVPR
jgi:CRISPR-associated protein Cas1